MSEPLKIDVKTVPDTTEEVQAQLQEALKIVAEQKPVGFVLIVEGGEKLSVRAAGGPADVVAMYLAGGDILRNMVQVAVNAAPPQSNEVKH